MKSLRVSRYLQRDSLLPGIRVFVISTSSVIALGGAPGFDYIISLDLLARFLRWAFTRSHSCLVPERSFELGSAWAQRLGSAAGPPTSGLAGIAGASSHRQPGAKGLCVQLPKAGITDHHHHHRHQRHHGAFLTLAWHLMKERKKKTKSHSHGPVSAVSPSDFSPSFHL